MLFGIGNRKKLGEQASDYAITVLVPAWTPELGPINEFLAAGTAPAVGAALRGSTADKHGNVAPASSTADFEASLRQQLVDNLPNPALPEAMARIAGPLAEEFAEEYPEGGLVRDLVDGVLRDYLAGISA